MSRRSHALSLDDPRLTGWFAQRRHATLTTLRADGSPHSVPVAPVVDLARGVALVLSSSGSVKVRNARRDPRVSLCELDGRHWVSVEGWARVERDPAVVAEAEHRYAERFRTPRVNPERVVLVVDIRRVLGSLPADAV